MVIKNEVLNLIWGKSDPFKPLIAHLIDSGCVLIALFDHGCLEPACDFLSHQLSLTNNKTKQTIAYMVALHDIGKCHPSFQGQAKESKAYEYLQKCNLLMSYNKQVCFRHEKYSALVLERIFREKNRSTRKTNKYVASLLGMHHQGKTGEGYEIFGNIKERWFSFQDELEDVLYSLYEPERIDLRECSHIDAICMILMGSAILSDWIASGHWFNDICWGNDPDIYQQKALTTAKKAIEECGLGGTKCLPVRNGFSGLWTCFSENSLRPVQNSIQFCYDVDQTAPMLTIIEAPMGEGKTEAGVYAAACMADRNSKQGFYIALPSAATSNQMFDRITELLRSHKISPARLLHSMAWVLDQSFTDESFNTEDAGTANTWLQPLKRGLLSNYAVGTVDQAMMAALKAKYGILRLLGLSNKVLIIDEIHAYDAYMSEIIELLLKWCKALKIPVVLLSATLPFKKRQSLIGAYEGEGIESQAYPLITTVDENGSVKEHAVPGSYIKRKIQVETLPLLADWTRIAVKALEKIKDNGCLCIIVNTVDEAQKLYMCLKTLADTDVRLMLFHARFIATERNAIEHACLSIFGKDNAVRPKTILVATQVVEQSLDLDFDEMFSCIAPIDLLLQRAGRLHRHDGRIRPSTMKHPKLTVITPLKDSAYGPTECIYAPLILNRTMDWLGRISCIRIPEDIRKLIDEVYELNMAESSELETWSSWVFQQELDRGAAMDYMLPVPNKRIFSLQETGLGTVFDDDESGSNYLTAKTRLGEPSARVAFLPEDVFNEVAGKDNKPGKDTAARVMGYSVSLRCNQICTIPAEGYSPPVEGTGLLKNMILYPVRNNRYEVKDDSIVGYRLDAELGVLIEKR